MSSIHSSALRWPSATPFDIPRFSMSDVDDEELESEMDDWGSWDEAGHDADSLYHLDALDDSESLEMDDHGVRSEVDLVDTESRLSEDVDPATFYTPDSRYANVALNRLKPQDTHVTEFTSSYWLNYVDENLTRVKRSLQGNS